ncbi:hypothetical protein prwr041_05900 [Prevotella herbatica]|uniref:NACHT domain-containing protein n=3 Tax=Prevotella TaxID=838 RepID=A0ABN6EFU7_9BACT|nr:hypothetical protein prwr041_05900 [Prevotella herbatica]
MNQQAKLSRISQLFSRFTEQIEILNSNSEFSMNIHVENVLIKLLNLIYNCDFKNVNYEENKIYPSIDLRDTKNRIAIQITSTPTLDKVKHTLYEFIKNDLYNDFDNLYIYIITKKQKKYTQSKIDEVLKGKFNFPSKNIIDKTDLYNELNAQNNLEKIDKVCKLLENQFSDTKTEMDKWDKYKKGLLEYDKYIMNLFMYLDIKGFSPKINNTLVKIKIDQVYIPLKLKLKPDYSNANREDKYKENLNLVDIKTAFLKYNQIVILGDPGSGKSTLLKYLAYDICNKRGKNRKYYNYVPIFIKAAEFAKYNSATGKNLSEYIIDGYNKIYETLFVDCLENNKLVVLFDGIDEVNITNQRHNIVDKINSFVAQYPSIKMIASSRIVGYNETCLNSCFYHFDVEKFGKEQIKSFIKNWYLSISSHSDNNTQVALKNANELFNSIRKNNSVLRLASNPLLITIIALIYYQGNALPEKRASLYEIATSTFLENWVKRRAFQKHDNIDRVSLVEILAPTSFYMHENYSTGLIPEKELRLKLMDEYRKIAPYLNPHDIKQDINDILEFLREDAGFLFEKGFDDNGDSLFGFVHQTFQEYFAAIEFKTKWKEGCFKENLNEYVFNSNWIEVIKLSASLFKINDPSRLGRADATKFIKDILELKDPYPEANKSLEVTCQILIDDVEIDLSVFKDLVDKIFDKHLSEKGNIIEERYIFVMINLLHTKYYQSYLFERISVIIKEDPLSKLSINLLSIFVASSDIPQIKEELIDILKSNKDNLKKQIYEYNTIIPVAEIVKTSEFRDEIVNYINSPLYLSIYNGNLPIQYVCCFDENLKDWLLSIRLISSQEMKKDLINFYVFSWGMDGVEAIKKYYDLLKKEYPNIDFSRIKKHIRKLDKFEFYKLDEYPFVTFNKVEIFRKIDSKSTFAFIKNEKVQLFEYPFNCKELKPYFGKHTTCFVDFLSLIICADNTESKEIIIDNYDKLINLIKFYKTIHWHNKIKINKAFNYALSIILITDIVNREILSWITVQLNKPYESVKIDTSFNKCDFEDKIMQSSLEAYEKLDILNAVSPQDDYKYLISAVIEELKNVKSESQKAKIRSLLHKIL